MDRLAFAGWPQAELPDKSNVTDARIEFTTQSVGESRGSTPEPGATACQRPPKLLPSGR